MTAPSREALPIEGTPVLAGNGWSVRLPVRAEEITIAKQVVVYERVLLHRRRVERVARLDAALRREELRATRSGQVDIADDDTEKIPSKLAHT